MARALLHPGLWFAVATTLAFGARADDRDSVVVRAERPTADGRSTTAVDLSTRRLEAEHLGDVLRAAPGAMPLDFGGVLATSTLSLRGGTADQVTLRLDGVPLGSPAGGGVDLSTIPSALLSRVVVDGGADARLGASAMSGAVELVPAASTRALLTFGSLGTFGASASATHDFAADRAVFRTTVALDARRSEGDFVFHRDPTPEVAGNDPLVTMLRANNDATLRSALVRVERRAPAGKLSAFAFGTWTDRGLPGPIYSPTPTSRQDERTLTASLGWHSDALDLPVFVRTGALDETGGDALTPTGTQSYLDVGATPGLSHALGPFVLRVAGLAGAETFDGVAQGHRTRLRGGAGVELSRDIGRLTGSLAGRVERWGDATGVLPRAGASLHVAKDTFVYASTGAGFRPPSFDELYYESGPILPNPSLLPERSWSADVGARYERPGTTTSLASHVDLFGGWYEDEIIYELFSGSRAKPFNLGEARTLGLEGEAHAKLETGLLRGLGGSLAVTLLDATNLVAGVNSYGKDLPYRPHARLDARVTYERSRVRASAGVDWTSEAFSNTANTRTVAPFADVRASVGVRLAGDLWLSAEVRNALDVTDRFCIEGYPLPGRVVLAHLAWLPEDAR